MKRIIVLVLILISLATSSFAEYYPRTAFVTSFDYMTDGVIVTDWAGMEWEFTGIEDWQIDDIVSMMMDDNNTPDNIYDDIIVQALYGGSI